MLVARFIFLYTIIEPVLSVRKYKIVNSQKQEDTGGIRTGFVLKHSSLESKVVFLIN